GAGEGGGHDGDGQPGERRGHPDGSGPRERFGLLPVPPASQHVDHRHRPDGDVPGRRPVRAGYRKARSIPVRRGTKQSATRRKGERGFALVAFAASMGVLFGLAAVATDLGRISRVANETQNVADIAATAGATNLLNGGNATTARTDAQTVVAQNRLAGSAAAIDTADIQVGTYNPQTNTFTNGANPPDAVKASKSTTVQNLFAGFFGSSFMNSTVTRSATAGFTGPGKAAVTLPLVIGDCKFGELKQCTLDPSCLPSLTQAPDPSNNSGWIKNDAPYYPSACG